MSKKQSRKGGNNRKNNKSKPKQSSITPNNKQNKNNKRNNSNNNKNSKQSESKNDTQQSLDTMIESFRPEIDLNIPTSFDISSYNPDNQCFVFILYHFHFLHIVSQ